MEFIWGLLLEDSGLSRYSLLDIADLSTNIFVQIHIHTYLSIYIYMGSQPPAPPRAPPLPQGGGGRGAGRGGSKTQHICSPPPCFHYDNILTVPIVGSKLST